MALQLSKLIEDKYNDFKLQQDKEATELELRNLSGMVAVLYAVSGIDNINEIEEGIIKQIYQTIIDKAIELDIDNTLIDRVKHNITNIIEKRNIKLSEALRYVIAYKDYQKGNFLSSLEFSIESIIEADGELTKEEEQFLERFKIFLKKGKDAIQEIEQAENDDIVPENYYIQSSTNNTSIINHPSTKLLKQNDNLFKNIANLTANKFYIIHPMDSNILLAVDDIVKIDEFIIDEFRSLACSLGAKKFVYTQSIIENQKEDTFVFLKSKFSSASQSGEIESSNKSDKENKSTNEISKTAEFSSGEKEDRHVVENNLLWLKNNYSIKQLLDQVYSKNSITKFEDDIYLEIFVKDNGNFDFNGNIKVAAINNAEAKLTMESKINNLKKTKQHILIEF
jgi:hypothetical protein